MSLKNQLRTFARDLNTTQDQLVNLLSTVPEDELNKIINDRGLGGRTPLMIAIISGHKPIIIKTLLAYGADESIKTNDLLTAYDIALQQGRESLKLLDPKYNSKNKAFYFIAKKENDNLRDYLYEKNPGLSIGFEIDDLEINTVQEYARLYENEEAIDIINQFLYTREEEPPQQDSEQHSAQDSHEIAEYKKIIQAQQLQIDRLIKSMIRLEEVIIDKLR